jgi:hypothetical protein
MLHNSWATTGATSLKDALLHSLSNYFNYLFAADRSLVSKSTFIWITSPTDFWLLSKKIGLTNLLRVKSWLRLWILLIHGSEWCAFCQLQISKWKAGDTGFGEHMRWNNACPYIRGKTVFNFTRRTELEKIEGARFYSMCIMHWVDISPISAVKIIIKICWIKCGNKTGVYKITKNGNY